MAGLAEASLLMAPNITGEGEAHMDDERAGLGVRVTAQLRQWVDRAQGLGVPLGCGGPTAGQTPCSFRRGGATTLLGAGVSQLLTNVLGRWTGNGSRAYFCMGTRTGRAGRRLLRSTHLARVTAGPACVSTAPLHTRSCGR